MDIIRDNKIITLTNEELEAAYREQQNVYRRDDVVEALQKMFENEDEFAAQYGLDFESMISNTCFLDAVIQEFDKRFDKNLGEDNIMETAINDVLDEYASKTVQAKRIDAVLIELPTETGIDRKTAVALAQVFGDDSEYYPIRVDGNSSWAMGYIRNELVDDERTLNSILSPVQAMMNDESLMQRHNSGDEAYIFKNGHINILIVRNIDSLSRAMTRLNAVKNNGSQDSDKELEKPVHLLLTCPECGSSEWQRTSGDPAFICAKCGIESNTEEMTTEVDGGKDEG